MQRLAVPPAAQQRTSDLAGDIVTLAAMEGVACPVLALAAALVLQSMAYGILVGLEEPAEAVMTEPAPPPLAKRLSEAEELVQAAREWHSPEEALFLLAAAAKIQAHRILVDWEIDPWMEGPERN